MYKRLLQLIANWLSADEHNATRLLKYHWHQDDAGSDLLLKSASNGFANSQYRLGTNLLNGEQGYFRAIRDLTTLYLDKQNTSQKVTYLIEQALEIDDSHPEILLNSAKLSLLKKDLKSAEKIALSALDAAQSKGFSTAEIQQFINKLNKS